MYDSCEYLITALKKNRFELEEFVYDFNMRWDEYRRDIQTEDGSRIFEASKILWDVLQEFGSNPGIIEKIKDNNGDAACALLATKTLQNGERRRTVLKYVKYLLEEHTEGGFYSEKWLWVMSNLFNLMAILEYIGSDEIEQAALDENVVNRLEKALPAKVKSVPLTTLRRMVILRSAFLVSNQGKSLSFDVEIALDNVKNYPDINSLCCFTDDVLQFTQQWLAIHVFEEANKGNHWRQPVGYYIANALYRRREQTDNKEGRLKIWRLIANEEHAKLENIWVYGSAEQMYEISEIFGITTDAEYAFPRNASSFSLVWEAKSFAEERIDDILAFDKDPSTAVDIGIPLKKFLDDNPRMSDIVWIPNNIICYDSNIITMGKSIEEMLEHVVCFKSSPVHVASGFYNRHTCDTGYMYCGGMRRAGLGDDFIWLLSDIMFAELNLEVCYTEKWAWMLANVDVAIAFALFVNDIDVLSAYKNEAVMDQLKSLELPVELTPMRVALIVRCVHSLFPGIRKDRRYSVSTIIEYLKRYPEQVKNLTVCRSDFQYTCTVDEALKIYKKRNGKKLTKLTSTYFLANYLESQGKWLNGSVLSDIIKVDYTAEGVDITEKVWMSYGTRMSYWANVFGIRYDIRFPVLVSEFPISSSALEKTVHILTDSDWITPDAMLWWKSMTKAKRRVAAIEIVFTAYGNFKRSQINELFDKAMEAGGNPNKVSEQCAVVADYLEGEGYFHVLTDTVTPLIRVLQIVEGSK